MKVSVTLSVEVDRDAWDEEHGTGTAAATVREDVLRYALTQMQQSGAATSGAITFVRLGMASGMQQTIPVTHRLR